MAWTHGGRGPDSGREPGPEPGPDEDGGRGLEDNDLEGLLGKALEQKSIWAGLYHSVRDAFFAPRLPPLELTSVPIAAPDRMAVHTNPWAMGTSALLNGAILALLVWLGLGRSQPSSGPSFIPRIDLAGLHQLAPLIRGALRDGGGSGGDHALVEPSRGAPPRVEVMPLTPPQVPLIEQPKLAVDPAVAAQIRLPENTAMLNVGMPNSTKVRLDSNGPGGPAGIGANDGNSYGPGHGPSLGPGDSGIFQPGVGGVTAPIPLKVPEAEFSDEARRAKYQGVCLISIIVDAQGMPRNPRVVRRLGMGLDEKAMEAVLKYRFKPAMRNGKPVPVMITVEVNFRLY